MIRSRIAAVVALATVFVAGLGGAAFATDPASASDVIGPNAATLLTQLLIVAAAVAASAVVFLAVRKGWRLLRAMF